MEKKKNNIEEQDEKDGLPVYPVKEDIYNKLVKEENIDPEDILKPKNINENDLVEDESGIDLDVPGAELDDEEEAIGSEDEENNYYSLGGDNHNDLDEDDGRD
jgi:hypothetical protein